MTRFILILLLIRISSDSTAQAPSIPQVVTHNRTTIICDPSTGSKAYAGWGVFPAGKVPVRKIIMHVTLGSPDTLLTAHWDYLDRIRLLRKGGVNAVNLNYELGRMLTPYGSIFGKGWSWKWEVDVTDFAPFLRDSVEIEYTHTGYEAPAVGWALTIGFEIISGPPVISFRGITPLWNAGFKYGDPSERFEDHVLPLSYETSPGTGITRVRIQHTGHGMDRPKNCSEFCPRWREISIDGKLVDLRNMWKDCGGNSLYPQGGTWVYDRAYWCPADLQKPDIIDVAATPGKHTIELKMEPYTATGNIQAVEQIAAYLFHYSAPLQKTDAAIEHIMVPTTEQQYFRYNPAGFNPRIVIRNLGSENLRSAVITYGTNGFAKKSYVWRGNLKFNESAEVVLPGEIDYRPGENTFTVSLTKPNGSKDAYAGDNTRTSVFNPPVMLPVNAVIQFKTNNRPADNRVFIISSKCDTVFSIQPAASDSNRLFQDTLRLQPGKYALCLTDTAGDGLEFWAEPQNGDGYLRIFDVHGNLIHAFESDCGNGENLSFEASAAFVTDTIQPKYAFSLYPRLVNDYTELSVVSNRTSDMTVLITVGGKVYGRHEYTGVKNGSFIYNTAYLPKGRIVVEVLMDGKSRFKGRVNKRS